jgi:Zn-dependent protease
MTSSVKLARIWGIPVGLHYSWFLIFFLLTWSLAAGYFPGEYPQLSMVWYVILGLVTTILFFGSVLAHELGHSYLALRNHIPVKGITLFIFGGVAQIAREPDTPGAEFRIAIAGPLVSLSLGLLFGLTWLAGQSVPVLAAPSRYLMRINLILALLNMIPGFPLDGGRVLRALVWWVGKDFYRANRIAVFAGRVVAMGFIGLGVYAIFNGQFFNGIWLTFIGLFLQNAAASASSQTVVKRALTGITVSQVMNRNCRIVPALMTINQLVEEQVLTGGQRCFFVADEVGLRGLLTLREITTLPQRKWRYTTAEQVMVPIKKLVKISPSTELISALQKMDDANIAQVPVLEGEDLVGVLSRENIVHYLRTRAELGV